VTPQTYLTSTSNNDFNQSQTIWHHKHLWQACPTMTLTNFRLSDTTNTCDKYVQLWLQQISGNLTAQIPVTAMSNNDFNKSQAMWHHKHPWQACLTMTSTNLMQPGTTNTCDKHIQQWLQQISDNVTPQTPVTSMSNNHLNKLQRIRHHRHLCKHVQLWLQQISGNLTPQTPVTSTSNSDSKISQAIWHYKHLWQACPTMT